MIRTLIVDDDSLVHVTLRSLIDWESCGYTVAADCSTGAQALAWLRENPVDLLITDIKMPGMSGLELMEALKKESGMPVTVVLSGYDEFELVREAFRLGAYDYFLKSRIQPEGLMRLLEGLRQKVFRHLSEAAGASERPAAGPPAPVPGDYVAVVFRVESFTQVAGRFDGNLREGLEKPMLELAHQIRRLSGRAQLWARDPSCYEMYYQVQARDRIQDIILSVVRQIQGVWKDFMNVETAAGISGVVTERELSTVWTRCDTLCRLSALKGPGSVCSAWQDGALALAYEEDASGCDGLIAALCSGEETIWQEESGRWFSALAGLADEEHGRRILVFLARLAGRLEDCGESFFAVFPEQRDFAKLLKRLETRQERELWLRNAMRRVQTVCADSRKKQQPGVIGRAQAFMQDNFTNPELTLRTVADYVGFNEKYFSTRFARECGCTFITYLNELRIKRAQELLVQTDMKMYEISDAVGYNNVEHFNHVFKKKLCISPRDYRQQQGKS